MKSQEYHWNRCLILLVVVACVSFSTKVAQAQGTNVTAKEIEIFGNDLQGKSIEMIAKFDEVSDTFVRLMLKDNNFVGFRVIDSKGNLFQFAFANKEKYGWALLQMKKGDDMRLTGRVRKIDTQYVFFVETISATSSPEADDKKKGIGVTAKEIEIFGNALQGKNIEMIAKFDEVSDTFVRLLLKDNNFVGFRVIDSKGNLFQFAFANKEKYGRTLLQMKNGDDMRLTGRVREIDTQYVFLVETISATSSPEADDKKKGTGGPPRKSKLSGTILKGKESR